MANFLHQPFLRELRTIDERDAMRYVYTFKVYEEALFCLPAFDLFPLLWRFAHDLFEISDYKLSIYYTDILINIVIEEAFTYDEEGNDLLTELLEQKTKAHQMLYDWKNAEYTSLELLRIQPNKSHFKLYRHNLAQQNTKIAQLMTSFGLILGLIAALLTGFIFIFVSPHYPDYYPIAHSIRLGSIGLALGLFCAAAFIQFWITHRKAKYEYNKALTQARYKGTKI